MSVKHKNKNTHLITPRQVEVMAAWAKYATKAELAQQLGISEHTVHTHLRRLRTKLKVQRTLDVYVYLLRHNYLEL